jgi:hypothetical protein
MTTHASILLAAIVLAVAATGGSTVQANGLPFFKPADGGNVDLVYFGQVKDRQGMPLSNVELAVETSSRYMYEIQFDQDRPGHYRSPDVGALYKEALQKVDPTVITITARKDGYKDVTRRVPLRAKGVLRVDFTMEPGEGASVDTTPASADAGTTSSDTFFMTGGLLAVGLIGVAAHRASRQSSIAG